VRFQDLPSWLAWLEGLHPSAIDLGLERVGRVARTMGVDRIAAPVLTVAGTNGKGSVCEFLASILAADGNRVGLYTSPHLARFNERVRVDGREAEDERLCEAFARVDACRGDTSLTYFEFGTLAALEVFARAEVDAVVLEVGLGGRLDATNVVSADVAVVTSIGLDHAEWLGRDLAVIAREKAGIGRYGRPLVSGEAEPPAALGETAAELGANLWLPDREYRWLRHGDHWDWYGPGMSWTGLPLPALEGGYQVRNAATALAALAAAGRRPGHATVADGLKRARIPGRFEVIAGRPETILDVAHNPAAAVTLAQALGERHCAGRTLAVLGMYRDKDAGGVVDALRACVDAWFVAGIPGERGRSARDLAALVSARASAAPNVSADPTAAYRAACAAARAGDRVVVLGSFVTVGAVRVILGRDDEAA